jgi:hypothetical protein
MGARLEGKICTSHIHAFEVMGQTAGSVCRRIGADAMTIISRYVLWRRQQSEGGSWELHDDDERRGPLLRSCVIRVVEASVVSVLSNRVFVGSR